MRARELGPGDFVGTREVVGVIHGVSPGPRAVPVVLVYFTASVPMAYAADHIVRGARSGAE